MPAPVPRLVSDAVGIVAWERKVKTKRRGLVRKPGEGGGEGEAFGERRIVGRGDVDGAAGVVFAVAGRSDEGENLIDGAASGEVRADDFGLTGDAAEARDGDERETRAVGGEVHIGPGGARRRGRRRTK